MIAFVDGTLAEVHADSCVVDTGGFGIYVAVPGRVSAVLPHVGDHVRLYTYTRVAEDAFDLYGFLSRDDLDMFKLCISVSGIGPKAGLAILSTLDADGLRLAIASGDTKAISAAPGVGPKSADRLILELKDKVGRIDTARMEAGGAEDALSGADAVSDAVAALVALGYPAPAALKAARRAVMEYDGDVDSGELLSAALKFL